MHQFFVTIFYCVGFAVDTKVPIARKTQNNQDKNLINFEITYLIKITIAICERHAITLLSDSVRHRKLTVLLISNNGVQTGKKTRSS